MANESSKGDMKFVITIPTYNTNDLILRSIHSALSQEYSQFRIIVINDASTDATKTFLDRFEPRAQLQIIHNQDRIGVLANHYKMAYMCEDDEIIVNLDGDDQLAHPYVLQKLALAYSDSETWMTYGSFAYDYLSRNPNGDSRGFARQVPPHQHNRLGGFCSTHLRTYQSWLFKRIEKQDLLDEDGNFYQWSMDHALMFPMIEMAGQEHAKYIHDILYLYNAVNPLCEHLQRSRDEIMLISNKIYSARIYPKLFYKGDYPQWI